MVPVRAVFEKFGLEVGWDGNTKTITGKNNDFDISLSLNNTTMMVNGKEVKLDVPAQLIDGRNLVPLRAIGDALNQDTQWYEDIKTVSIRSKEKKIDYVELYNYEGNKVKVEKDLINEYYLYGYNENPEFTGTSMFSRRWGYVLSVVKSKVDEYKKTGYDVGIPVKMYLPGGMNLYVTAEEAKQRKADGSAYYSMPKTVFSKSGQIKTIESTEYEQYLKNGWYDSTPVVMYAEDGRTVTIGSSKLRAYTAVGWFYGKPMTAYSVYGETMRIGYDDFLYTYGGGNPGSDWFASKAEVNAELKRRKDVENMPIGQG